MDRRARDGEGKMRGDLVTVVQRSNESFLLGRESIWEET